MDSRLRLTPRSLVSRDCSRRTTYSSRRSGWTRGVANLLMKLYEKAGTEAKAAVRRDGAPPQNKKTGAPIP